MRQRVSRDIAQLTDFCILRPGQKQVQILPDDADLEQLYIQHGVPLNGRSKSTEEEYIVFNKMLLKEFPEN